MKLRLDRLELVDGYTIGRLYVDDEPECWALEDTVRFPGVKIHGKTAIPSGTYKVVIDQSVRFGKMMLHLLDVPLFDGIRIHAGNTAADTEGCILVGMDRFPGRIGRSRVALEMLQPKVQAALDRGEEVTIEVRNQPQAIPQG